MAPGGPGLGRGTIAWILALPLLLAWPLPGVLTTEVLARPGSEAAIHIWGLWAAGVARHPFILDTVHLAWPDGFVGVLVDPLNLPAFLLGLLVSIPLAYNLILYLGLALAGLVGALFANRVGGSPMVGALVAAASPPLLSQAGLGMTETFAVGTVGLSLWALLRCLDGPSWRWRVLAGLALGASWYAGPYNGLWSSLLCLVVGLVALVQGRQRLRERLTSLSAVAGIGLVLALPLGWAVMTLRLAGQPGTAAAAGILPPRISNRFFRGGVHGGADLTDPFLPLFLSGGEASDSHTAYLGAAALLLAGLAVWRRRSLWPWLAGALGMAIIALGPWLVVAGEPAQSADGRQLMTPLGWLILMLPFLGRVTHWYRAAAVGLMLLAAPVSTLARGWARGLAIAAVVLLDLALCAPMTWPLHSTPLPDTAVFDALVGPGAVLTLPASTGQQPAAGNWRNRILLDQITHGRPIAGVAAWGGSPGPSGSHAQMLVQGVADHGTLDRIEQNGFAGAGFRWLVVYHRLLPRDPARSRRLERCLGPPISGDEEVRIYTLERLRPEGCLGPHGPSP